jgi:hypothetical protein
MTRARGILTAGAAPSHRILFALISELRAGPHLPLNPSGAAPSAHASLTHGRWGGQLGWRMWPTSRHTLLYVSPDELRGAEWILAGYPFELDGWSPPSLPR